MFLINCKATRKLGSVIDHSMPKVRRYANISGWGREARQPLVFTGLFSWLLIIQAYSNYSRLNDVRVLLTAKYLI